MAGRCLYPDAAGSDCCCLKSQSKNKRRLLLNRIDCALRDDVTRQAFLTFCRNCENEKCVKLITFYGQLWENHVNGRSQDCLSTMKEIVDEDILEIQQSESFSARYEERAPNSRKIISLTKEMLSVITEEVNHLFELFREENTG